MISKNTTVFNFDIIDDRLEPKALQKDVEDVLQKPTTTLEKIVDNLMEQENFKRKSV